MIDIKVYEFLRTLHNYLNNFLESLFLEIFRSPTYILYININ